MSEFKSNDQPHYTIKLGDIISMEIVSYDKINRPVIAKRLPPLDLSCLASFTFGVATITFTRSATIRPWVRWAIPATRCQRIRGEK